MPALPGAHLILIHADFALASLKTRFNTGTCFDHPRQFCQRRFFERQLGPSRRREVIMVAMLGVLIGGIARGAGLEGLVVARGRRVTTNHSSGPGRLRSIRVCTRRLTSSTATGPFSPSRTVTWVHASPGRPWRHAVTDCHGAFGRRPRPAYAGNGASRSRIAVVQGIPSTYRSPRSRRS